MKSLNTLPEGLPVPIDDGTCDHLTGMIFPSVILHGTSGKNVNISGMKGLVVIFFYPMHGNPKSPPMIGWNEIPGARGCTPQSCSFRDNYAKLEELGVSVFGVSSQSLSDQKEACLRLALPYQLLNDSSYKLTNAMNLPTFDYESYKYIKRITIILQDGVIKRTFYPVFPPDKNVGNVIDWVVSNTNSEV